MICDVYFRFVAECTIFAQILGISVSKGVEIDSLAVISRHGVVSLLQYDSLTVSFKTIFQNCYSLETGCVDESFRLRCFRVFNQYAVFQLSFDSLTFVHMSDEGGSFTVPVSLGSSLGLASIDDVQFVCTSSSKVVVLAILGKSVSHAWIGRTCTIGSFASVVRVVSVDFGSSQILSNWTFDSLPTESFSIISLSQPRGGLLVIAPDSVSYCEDFGASLTLPVEADMDGCVAVAISDNLVIFATSAPAMDPKLWCAHLVRRSGTFSNVTHIVWEELRGVADPSTSVAVGSDGLILFGSRFGSSFLFQISETEVLLPVPVFAPIMQEEMVLGDLASTPDTAASELISMYQEEIHAFKICKSIELGLLDELEGWGQILTLVVSEGGLVATTSSGSLVSLYSDHPSELLVELNLAGFTQGIAVFETANSHTFFALFGNAGFILLDSTVGIKETLRMNVEAEFGSGAILGCTSGGLLVCENGTFSIFEKRFEKFDFTAKLASCNGENFALLASDNTVRIYHDEVNRVLFEGSVEIVCVNLGGEFGNITTIADVCGSLTMFNVAGEVLFSSKHVSLAKPILLESSEDQEACFSITDVTRRPTEIHPSVEIFASKILIQNAIFTRESLLVILVENRPPLVYRQLSERSFALQLLDFPHLVGPSLSRCNNSSIIPVNDQCVMSVSVSDRGQILAHPIFESGCVAASLFTSQFATQGLVTATHDGKVRIYKLTECERRFGSCFAKVFESTKTRGLQTAVSVAGLAVAEMSREILVTPTVQPDSTNNEIPTSDDTQKPQADETSTNTSFMGIPGELFTLNVFAKYDLEILISKMALLPDEMVTDMCWAESVLGLGPDVLAVGTTMLLGEEHAAQGRILLIRVDMNAVAVPCDASLAISGAKLIYESDKKSAVTVMKDWKGCLVVALGHRFMFYQWDGTAGRLRGCGMYDMCLQITSTCFVRSFIVAGDILRGIHLLRYKEDPVIDVQTGAVTSIAASIQFMAKTPPSYEAQTIVGLNTIRFGNTLGIISVDKYYRIDLHVFSPLHYGQYLRPSIGFQLTDPILGFANVSSGPDFSSLVTGSASGALAQIIPVNEADHHLASSLLGLMVTLLPQIGGVNPRLQHTVMKDKSSGAVQGIESADSLLAFLYLSTPLQAEIASKMKQSIDVLAESVASWLRLRW